MLFKSVRLGDFTMYIKSLEKLSLTCLPWIIHITQFLNNQRNVCPISIGKCYYFSIIKTIFSCFGEWNFEELENRIKMECRRHTENYIKAFFKSCRLMRSKYIPLKLSCIVLLTKFRVLCKEGSDLPVSNRSFYDLFKKIIMQIIIIRQKIIIFYVAFVQCC